MDHPQVRYLLSFLFAEILICGIRAGELSVTPLRGNGDGSQHCRHLWTFVPLAIASVNVPMKRPVQVTSRRILRCVQGHSIDARYRMVAGCIVNIAPLRTQLDLHLRLKVKVTKHQDAIDADSVEDFRSQPIVVHQSVGIDTDDFSADRLGQRIHGNGCALGHGNGSFIR
jgi:hypothetical protein